MTAGLDYMDAAEQILKRIRDNEMETIARAAEICAHTIANDGLVHMFGTGHSRMFVEEMYPRHGSFPGFHPLVELSLTYHNQVVGTNGQRQAMYLEHLEGFAAVILRNFVLSYPDSFLIFSNSGVNEVVVAVISREHAASQQARHSSGHKLADVADVTIDNGTPAGDAMVRIAGLDDPVGPGSTIGAAAVTNALKCAIAERLVALGKPPQILTSSYFIGGEASARRFDDSDDYRRRLKRVYGCD
jgi:uncharacterized phosphosugar-binding protein